MEQASWVRLQNGSDIRGVAVAGIADQPVNLTAAHANSIGQAFAHWLVTIINH
ncbi:hypothetical protein [Thiomicrospira sp. ALE5]|uniref:hypothetical protein n=1 Tax=Thiomicrospira sp. ALE5 TaxID=748650 RepID=UPI001F38C2CC|nr:hypothetical protein [Thiomicrospira sp. ALE5]